MPQLRRTPLYSAHQQLGARLIDFHGWELPVQYRGIVAEHLAVRSAAGLFDVSHMGEFWVEGANAFEALQGLLTNDLQRLAVGGVQYTFLCNEQGGVIDDLTVFRVQEDRYLLCVNAANTQADWAWMRQRLPAAVAARDASKETALMALQGPRAAAALQPLVPLDLRAVKRFRCAETAVAGKSALVSRTGYTGEDGFEIFVNAADAEPVFTRLLDAPAEPCGLGARDTLRSEAGYPLHGQDLDVDTSPVEAGLERFVALGKGPFVGREALARQLERGAPRRRIGLRLRARSVARPGYRILYNGREVGRVSSGTFSPSLKIPIAMGYVETDAASRAATVQVEIRGRLEEAQVCSFPFYPPPG